MRNITKADIQRLQAKLEACREKAFRTLVRLGNEAREMDVESPMDIADRSVGHLVRESLYLQGSQCRNQLRSVESALERIREGTYGNCGVCGEDIQPRRLEALPWTNCCLRCQEQRERQLETGSSSGEPRVAWGRTA
ncbi:MAG TPA: TraR/DksA family transcriptional regulator [Terriglobales bacterium]|nr:TraR/DksA family transcriptional regulator [Terriglobales bacterium]